MEDIDREYPSCCTNPEYVDGWIQLKIFKIKYCKNCGEIMSNNNFFLDIIWEFFFAPYWNGKVYLIKNDEES